MDHIARLVVLIVEDEDLIRLCAADAFDPEVYEIFEAEHSAAAIIMALDLPRIDLLFTDVNMPGAMNGIELAEHLFALRPALKIIVTSALPLLRNLDHLQAHFLPKPYDLGVLEPTAHGLLAA
jgi:CheY-like chemotaxis protein